MFTMEVPCTYPRSILTSFSFYFSFCNKEIAPTPPPPPPPPLSFFFGCIQLDLLTIYIQHWDYQSIGPALVFNHQTSHMYSIVFPYLSCCLAIRLWKNIDNPHLSIFLFFCNNQTSFLCLIGVHILSYFYHRPLSTQQRKSTRRSKMEYLILIMR